MEKDTKNIVSIKDLPIDKIVNLLSDIDNKILSMHECSNNDFVILNTNLKNYNVDIEKIAKSREDIKNIINEEKLEVLKDLQAKLKQYTEFFELELETVMSIIDTILLSINMLFVPLRNFKQNLMTLKFLITNLKLNATYYEQENHEAIDNTVNKIYDIIYMVNNENINIDINTNKLKIAINSKYAELKFKRDVNIYNVNHLYNEINIMLNHIFGDHQEIMSNVDVLNVLKSSSSGNVSKIITNLQYHDIIKQKIDHIYDTHKEIIKELNKNDINANYLYKIPDIAELQVAQLTLINKEYQAAIDNIKQQFDEISHRVANVADNVYDSDNHVEEKYSEFSRSILTKLKDWLENINELTENKGDYDYDSLYELFMKVISNIRFIIKCNNDVLDSVKLLYSFQTNKNNYILINNQIASVLEDVNNQVESIDKIYNNVIQLNGDFNDKVIKLYSGITYNDYLKNMSSVSEYSLNNLFKANLKVFGILSSVSNNCSVMSEVLKESIKDVKYYDYFEKEIESVILFLNNICFDLKNHLKLETTNKADNIENIKNIYTMQSERDVHDSFSNLNQTNMFDVADINGASANTNADEDDNFELF